MGFKERVIALESERDTKRKQLQSIEQKQKQTAADIKALERAAQHIKSVAQYTLDDIKKFIEKRVTEAIQILSPDLEFRVEFVDKRGTLETHFWIHNTDLNFDADPIDASGGGLVDLVSFALRMVFWQLTKDKRNTLILDEPFKFVSVDIPDEELLYELSRLLGMQIVVVTHKQKFIDDLSKNAAVFHVKKIDGVSHSEKHTTKE